MLYRCVLLLAIVTLYGCSTAAGKKAMAKPLKSDAYSSFDKEKSDDSRRKAEVPPPVKHDEDPEVAVGKLIHQLQGERPAAISAEEQLMIWGQKPGVGRIVYGQARQLLKHDKVEVRGPALRLTATYGGREATGDLIEALADESYAMRSEAFRALQQRTRRDFGFNPGGSETARARGLESWRNWWQVEQTRTAVQPPSIYEKDRPNEPRVVRPE